MKDEKAIACQIAQILAKDLGVVSEQRAQNLCNLFESYSKQAFDYFIIEEGFVEKDDVLKALSIYYNVPLFDARGYYFEHHLLRMFPKDVLLRGGFIPISLDEPTLLVAVANPLDPALAEIIGSYVSYDITFFVGLRGDIEDAIKEFYELSITVVDEYPEREVQEEEHEAADFHEMMYGEDEE